MTHFNKYQKKMDGIKQVIKYIDNGPVIFTHIF